MDNNFRETKKYKEGIFKSKEEIVQSLKKSGVDRIYYALSFGGGTQSTHLLEDHFNGKIHYDYIIMSDTGAEPDFIHKQVKWWMDRAKEKNCPTPFLMTHHNKMEEGLEEMLFRYFYDDGFKRFQLPIYCSNIVDGEVVPGGMMKRQCTVDYKIRPVQQLFRKLVMKREGIINNRMPKNIALIMDLGFSYDEIKRVNRYQSMEYKYVYLAYPLIEMGLSTDDSINFLKDNNFPSKRSRCYLCPFNCNGDKNFSMSWDEIIAEEPLSFLKACFFDTTLRAIQTYGKKNMTSIPYLHFKRIPLNHIYKEDYIRLSEIYSQEIKEWIEQWKIKIDEKYTNIC